LAKEIARVSNYLRDDVITKGEGKGEN
jgi:hypothetical protein